MRHSDDVMTPEYWAAACAHLSKKRQGDEASDSSVW